MIKSTPLHTTIAMFHCIAHRARLLTLSLAIVAACVIGPVSAFAQSVMWSQRLVSGPSPRFHHAMAFDAARGVTVLFGGYNTTSNIYHSDTWVWNGTTWTQRMVSGPSSRMGHAMVYDSARGVTVLFGGFNGATSFADTWEWNGTAWTLRAVSGPSLRYFHAMAYDSARGVTVLFGGTNSSAFGSAETWEWNGTAWTLRMVSGPVGRYGHAMAYDASRGVSVLFAGLKSGNVTNAETWEWNGTTWTQRVVSGPSSRHHFPMSYDAARGVTVLFGGFDSTVGQTWEWNGTGAGTWTQQMVTGSTVQGGHKMAYDSARGITVLFGGFSSGVGENSQTWEMCAVASITFQPAPQAPCFGGTAAFSVSVSPPNGIFAYQWQKKNPIFFNVYNDVFNGPTGNGGTYSGAQSSTLTISGVFPNDLGEFRCVVTGVCQSIVSNDAALEGPPSPFITSGPNVAAGCAGGSGSMSVTATPAGSTYQWQRYVGPCILCYVDVFDGPTGNGGTLSGAQSPTLTITGLNQFDTFSQYRCIVTGPCANTQPAASNDAFFTIMGLPLAAAPQPPEVCPGGTVSISMNTQNVTNFLWEYYSNFINGWVPFSNGQLNDFGAGLFATVSGANTDTLTLSNTSLGAPIAIRFSGGNMCQIMAPIQTLLNYPALPTITSQPATTSYCFGQPASFTVGASSQLPLTYQWQLYHTALLQWINLSDGFYVGGATGLSGTIAGATTPTLTFTTATIGTVAPNQPFRCVVSHGCGSATSQTANLYICAADVNCDGNVDFFDYLDFVDAFSEQSPIGDFNQDNSIDFFDYLDFVDAFSLGC